MNLTFLKTLDMNGVWKHNFITKSKICNDYLGYRKNGGGMYGGREGGKDEKTTLYRKELTCTCMLGTEIKWNNCIWDSFAGCVYVRHPDFKHHNAEK